MFDYQIPASWDRLFDESRENADTRLGDAIRAAIKATKDLPAGVDRAALIVAHMRTAQEEFASACLSIAAQRLADSISEVAAAIREAAHE